MSLTSDNRSERMVQVIRRAIVDPSVMKSLSPKDLVAVLEGSMDLLTPRDVRGFIYRCLTSNNIPNGLTMVNQVVAYAQELLKKDNNTISLELVGAAVGTLSLLSESIPFAKAKLDRLLSHECPAIVAVTIQNLGHSSEIGNFQRSCSLLLHGDFQVAIAAARYIEDCSRDAAFRRRKEFLVVEDEAEEFLRKALVPLEHVYEELKKKAGEDYNIRKRVSVLVAMIYNEILDATDWKRTKSEDVDERIYYALEQHLNDNIAPQALPNLSKMLKRPDLENGTIISALNTIGRISKIEAFREEIVAVMEDVVSEGANESIVNTAKRILKACREMSSYSVIPEPNDRRGSSIVPRTAGAPPKLENK